MSNPFSIVEKMSLPASIWNLIFQYDMTYHEKYRNDVLEELKRINWKVVWVNSDRRTQYGLTENWAETVCAYWNKTYATFYNLSQAQNPQQCYMTLNVLSHGCKNIK